MTRKNILVYFFHCCKEMCYINHNGADEVGSKSFISTETFGEGRPFPGYLSVINISYDPIHYQVETTPPAYYQGFIGQDAIYSCGDDGCTKCATKADYEKTSLYKGTNFCKGGQPYGPPDSWYGPGGCLDGSDMTLKAQTCVVESPLIQKFCSKQGVWYSFNYAASKCSGFDDGYNIESYKTYKVPVDVVKFFKNCPGSSGNKDCSKTHGCPAVNTNFASIMKTTPVVTSGISGNFGGACDHFKLYIKRKAVITIVAITIGLVVAGILAYIFLR